MAIGRPIECGQLRKLLIIRGEPFPQYDIGKRLPALDRWIFSPQLIALYPLQIFFCPPMKHWRLQCRWQSWQFVPLHFFPPLGQKKNLREAFSIRRYFPESNTLIPSPLVSCSHMAFFSTDMSLSVHFRGHFNCWTPHTFCPVDQPLERQWKAPYFSIRVFISVLSLLRLFTPQSDTTWSPFCWMTSWLWPCFLHGK